MLTPDGKLTTQFYDTRDDFTLSIVNFSYMLQGYNESRIKSSFPNFYGSYNDLVYVCDYKLPMAHMLNDLKTVVSILALTMGNPVYLLSTKGAQRV
jgi:hypothetical protein